MANDPESKSPRCPRCGSHPAAPTINCCAVLSGGRKHPYEPSSPGAIQRVTEDEEAPPQSSRRWYQEVDV